VEQAVDTGETNELFYYDFAKLKLKKGERSYIPLFSLTIPYERFYAWDVRPEVEHQRIPFFQPVFLRAKFKNIGDQPWASGTVAVYEQDELLAEQAVRYTPRTGEMELRLNQAPDIMATAVERQASVKGKAFKVSGYSYDLEHWDVEIKLENLRRDAFQMIVRAEVQGKFESCSQEPTKKVATAKKHSVNSMSFVEWVVTLQPGQKLELQYQYSKYV
jgi:hypothetical protein